MKKLSSNEIRNMFLSFFESKGHLIVPSASLIPDNDPSLLWINAGVAPLKKYFDGRENPPKRRLTNAQKCIRTNDIENVGDTYHHTFFEMLGNFSIGDYFRDDALAYAWELLTSDKYFNIDKERLYVTVYTDDKDAYDRWVSLGIDKSHIIKCDGNFWDIGPGPCGPDSEIFYDRGVEYDERGPELIEKDIDNDRYIEIWNNVFSQFNHIEGKDRKDFPELPHKNIDTGMGLERLVCVLQDCKTNYDTDLFRPIITKLEEMTGIKYTDQKSFRSIADHIKTLTFALADGAEFSNEGRGYVLRRILRRASRFGRMIGLYEPFMYKLTSSVIDIMGECYPYLNEHKDYIDNAIKKEEEAFLKTLVQGEKRLDELVTSGNKITGSDVFKLYDTYGFPYELTCEILNEKNIKIDEKEYEECMNHQKEMARCASKKISGMKAQGDLVDFKEETTFTGYDKLEDTSNVIFVGDNDGNKENIFYEGIVITKNTPFYATMGGQKGDIGTISNDNLKAEVIGCEKAVNGQTIHYIRIISGTINEGDIVTLKVDKLNRFYISQNHSATHLLQRALRNVLGEEVSQAGSYVDSDTLRFDFKYTGKITDDNLIEVEENVNKMISDALPKKVVETNIDDAIKMGATHLFSEKYGDRVRVVSFGESIELCGGTHVDNTNLIKRFAIKSIESKGLNIYRIEAVCDRNLEIELFSVIKPYNDEMMLLLNKAKKIINKAKEEDIILNINIDISNERPKCYKDILENKEEVNKLKKELANLEKKYNEELTNKLLKNTDLYVSKKVNGKYGEVVIIDFNNYDLNALKALTGDILSKLTNGIVFILNIKDDAINFICKADTKLKDVFNAGMLIKDVAKIAEGSGGGSPFFAQGGGTRSDKKDVIIKYVTDKIIEE